ncbi:hypothetical protein CI105_05490 [Candidatus Izimaplasma bacterium ZiA1]|uniref:Cof-type HAD-IIB family hydrolase n=1 Tax=Candidatus Izimoplasma sp. ZiA1 TaxID=2024899 RepID=UPI000BAA44D8|nr:hypothetical protein CI105_05490 [Candidatus Izimaplasma bacterium ZiA1]
MYKLVVSDVDGTLLNSDHQLLDETKEYLISLKKQNILFTLASGRHNDLMKKLYDELEIEIPAISSNGSFVGNPITKDTLYQSVIDTNVILNAVKLAKKHGSAYIIYTKDTLIANDHPSIESLIQRSNNEEERYRFNIIKHRDFKEDLASLKINKFLFIEDDPIKFKAIWEELKTYQNIEFTESQTGYLDITGQNVHKGNAVKELAKYLNIDIKDVICFGDQGNDLEMIKMAGLGVAMGNGIDELKANSDFITLSNNDQGVMYALKKYLKTNS